MGLTQRARSCSVAVVWRCSRQDRTCSPIFFMAVLLTAGPKPVNTVPCLLRAARARNVNPRKSNDVCSCEPVRRASLQ